MRRQAAALLACLILTAGVLSSCEREETSTASPDVKAYLNEDGQNIKRLESKADTLEGRIGALERRIGALESNTDTSSVTYLERRVGELERQMHALRQTQR